MGASATAFWRGLSPNQRGAIWMILAAAGFTVNSAMVKALAASGMHPMQIGFARAFFALGPLIPFLLRNGIGELATRHPFIHMIRGFSGAGAMLCGFFALSVLPLADVTALSFTTPLFTILLAVVILRERVRWRRWAATAVGFLGVLIMVRPGATAIEPGALLALGMAFGISLATTLVKRLPPGESRVAMLFWFCSASVLITAGPAIALWQDPEPFQWLLLIGIGLLGVGAQSLIIQAYKEGEATFVAPFDYSKLLLAVVIGLVLFGEVPDVWTLVGAAVIVAATLYIARREARLGRENPPPAVGQG